MKKHRIREQLRHALRRELWLTLGPPLLVTLATFFLAFHFVKPAPPSSLVLAVGRDDGGARWYANRYKEVLAKNGVTVEVRQTEGSVPNLRLLEDAQSGVDVAFVQGGTPIAGDTSEIVSLGSVSYVPLWVFYRGDAIPDPRELKGKRIAIGAPESGTHVLAKQLLAIGGADAAPTELLALDRDAAIEKLKAGEIDAMFAVSPAEAPAIQKLAATPGIRLLDFARADAFSRRFPFLTRLTVPRGVLDLAADVPAEDVALVSPTQNLFARTNLHPALAYLLMRAASEIHGRSGLLHKAGDFPSARDAGVPLSDVARRYYQSGAPLLQRYLPYWAANLVDRLWVMLLPIIAVLVPLARAIPPLYRWRVRSRIYRWYARLKELELELEERPGLVALAAMRDRLDAIERAVNAIPTPLAYAEHLYFFREHVDLVRRRIAARLASPEAAAEVRTEVA